MKLQKLTTNKMEANSPIQVERKLERVFHKDSQSVMKHVLFYHYVLKSTFNIYMNTLALRVKGKLLVTLYGTKALHLLKSNITRYFSFMQKVTKYVLKALIILASSIIRLQDPGYIN